MLEDVHHTLGEIRDRFPNGLVSELLEIQKHQVVDSKWLEWAKNPLCLCKEPQKLNRKRKRGVETAQLSDESKTFRRIQRFGKPYVAVSYTYEASESEPETRTSGGYRIVGSTQGSVTTPTKVRDRVVQRAMNYADRHRVKLIWIDDECINRDDPDEHEMAMQSMDLIYSFSKYPVGLLTKPIKTAEQLDLLQGLLHSDFVEYSGGPDPPVLMPEMSVTMASKIVDLLVYMTSDKWWTRAWIFQEDYRSAVKMTLLIPRSPLLSGIQAEGELCSIPGELQVKSVAFHEQSTLFCLACLDKKGEKWQNAHSKCENILRKAGKYNLLYQHGYLAGQESARRAMSPYIFTDIGNRDISVATDLLAIAANCCNYSIRLNTKSLESTSHSLSMSILALYLLNGEIIMNDKHDEKMLNDDIFGYLRQIALDNFDPPVKNKELTFIKRCRLVDVRLMPDGIVTSGRLWKLHKAIDTDELTLRTRPEGETPNGLNGYQRSLLRQLCVELQLQGYKPLAEDLDEYLNDDIDGKWSPEKSYKDLMAERIVEAIRQRMTIHLGCLVGRNPYRGIFVTDPALETPPYVFTAWCLTGSGGKTWNNTKAERSLDKIVSLAVDATDLEEALPRLKTRTWINGLCFFKGEPSRDVVFTYPKSLTG